MDNKILPKKVYFENAIEELGLTRMSAAGALHTLYLYFQYDGLPLYFDDTVIGTEADHELEPTSNSELLIANGTSEECSYGKKRVLEAFHTNSSDRYFLTVSRFQYKDAAYYPCDKAGMILNPFPLDTSGIYFDRQELANFRKRLGEGFIENKPNSETNYEKGEFKALALLAREMAEEGTTKFAINGKVNSHTVMEHLLKLSINYHISDRGLKKIDDKINKALDHHDLKHVGK